MTPGRSQQCGAFCVIPPEYLTTCVQVLCGGEVDCADGPVRYFGRTRLAGLWRQFLGYGFCEGRAIRKCDGAPSSTRNLVPAAFVCVKLGTLVIDGAKRLWFLLVCVLGPCATFLLTATAQPLVRYRSRAALLVPGAFAAMHVTHGLGFLQVLAPPVERTFPAALVAKRQIA